MMIGFESVGIVNILAPWAKMSFYLLERSGCDSFGSKDGGFIWSISAETASVKCIF
jgi:hypothetical protein